MSAVSALMGNGTDYWLTRWLLQRSLAVIYLVGFLVAVNQFRPLLGTHGLTPVPFFLQRVSFWKTPSLFYLHYSDGLAMAFAWIGVICAVLAVAGISERFGTPVSMAIWFVMWLLYLSFVNVGQTWYSFGWETLLLEAGFLAIFLGARNVAPPVIVIWMFRWVLFRLMFGAGTHQAARRSVLARPHLPHLPLPEPADPESAELVLQPAARLDRQGGRALQSPRRTGGTVRLPGPVTPDPLHRGHHHHCVSGNADPERQSLLAQLDHHRDRNCLLRRQDSLASAAGARGQRWSRWRCRTRSRSPGWYC